MQTEYADGSLGKPVELSEEPEAMQAEIEGALTEPGAVGVRISGWQHVRESLARRDRRPHPQRRERPGKWAVGKVHHGQRERARRRRQMAEGKLKA